VMAVGMKTSWLPSLHRLGILVSSKKDADVIGCLIAFCREDVVTGGVDGHSWIEFWITDEWAGV
jgi:hypothetical protein